MGWDPEVVRASEVVISGYPDALLVYQGAPGPGKLIASIVASAGTDPYGNAFQGGVTSYNGAGNYISIANSVISFSDGAQIVNQPGLLAFSATGAVAMALLPITGGVVAVQPGTTATPETWHNMTLGNGWTGTAQYKLEPNNRVSVRTVGTLAAGTLANGTVIASLPAAYAPPSAAQSVEATITSVGSGSAATGNTPYLLAGTTGAITVNNMATQAATNIRFNGSYPLD